jgi:hypothetical protein
VQEFLMLYDLWSRSIWPLKVPAMTPSELTLPETGTVGGGVKSEELK